MRPWDGCWARCLIRYLLCATDLSHALRDSVVPYAVLYNAVFNTSKQLIDVQHDHGQGVQHCQIVADRNMARQ